MKARAQVAAYADKIRNAWLAVRRPRVRRAGLRADTSVLRRLSGGFGANVYGQVVTVAVQLLSVPAFLHYWGTRQYGVWLMLSAVPAYFSIADAGMVSVAMNKMTMLRASGDISRSNTVFQSVFLLTMLVISAVAIPAGLIVSTVEIGVLDTAAKRWSLLALIATALATVFSGLFEAVLVASGRYAAAIVGTNTARLIEWAAGMVALSSGGGFLTVALAMLGMRLAAALAQWIYVSAAQPQFIWGLDSASGRELKEMTRPALAFMIFPMGSALSLQGTTLLVGALLGPVLLTTFNTYRTVSRVVVQLIVSLNRAVWPEFSRLYGAGSFGRLQDTYLKMNKLSTGVTVVAASGVFAAAPVLLTFWTKRMVPFEPVLFGLFTLCTVANGVSQLSRVLLLATNRHGSLASFYLLFSVAALPLSGICAIAIGAAGAVVGSLLSEVALAVVSYKLAAQSLRGTRSPATALP